MRYAVRVQIAPVGTEPWAETGSRHWRSVAYAPSAELYADAVDHELVTGAVVDRAEVCISTHPQAWQWDLEVCPREMQLALFEIAQATIYDPARLEPRHLSTVAREG